MLDIPKDGDIDPVETQEWLDSLQAVVSYEGHDRAKFLLEKLGEKARETGVHLPFNANTPYLNTIPPSEEERNPGPAAIEWRIRTIIRWNAMAMVVRANKVTSELGGHIASFASSATLYDVGFNHFWHAPSESHGGDLVFIQGHSAPGIYARAFMEGRLGEADLDKFRQEVDGGGLSSYPHPWLMPDFWKFPTVSMGLGPLMAIYQARFMRYLHDRGILETEGRKVWAFMGDGEMDEPESLGAIALAAREKLDNLDIRHQLQPATARRAGPRQRQDHSGTGAELPGHRLECHQGDLGLQLGSALDARQARAPAQAHGGMRRRRISGVQGQGWRVHPRELLRQVSGTEGDGRGSERLRHLASRPRRS